MSLAAEKDIQPRLSIFGVLEQIIPGFSSLIAKLPPKSIGKDDVVFAGPAANRPDLLKQAPGKQETIWQMSQIKEMEKAVNVTAVYRYSPDRGEYYSIYIKTGHFGHDKKICEIPTDGIAHNLKHEYLLSELRKRIKVKKLVVHTS